MLRRRAGSDPAGRCRAHCRGGTAASPQPWHRCSSSPPASPRPYSARRLRLRRRRRPSERERCGCHACSAPPPREWPPSRRGTTRAAHRRRSAVRVRVRVRVRVSAPKTVGGPAGHASIEKPSSVISRVKTSAVPGAVRLMSMSMRTWLGVGVRVRVRVRVRARARVDEHVHAHRRECFDALAA